MYWNGDDGHRFNATYFNTKFDDKIARGDTVYSCATTGGARPCVNLGNYEALGYGTYSQKINIDKVSVQGVELAGRWLISDKWSLNANYTWTDSEQESGPSAGQPLTNTAEHMANTTLEWMLLDNLTLSLQGEFRSDRFRDWDSVQDKALFYKNYQLINLGINYGITENISVNGRVNNLFDEDFTSYTTAFVDLNGDSLYTLDDEVIFTDDYNVKDAARNFWMSVQVQF